MKTMSIGEASELLGRRKEVDPLFRGRVAHIIETVRTGDDAALRGLAAWLNDPEPRELTLSGASNLIGEATECILRKSLKNISSFAAKTAEAAVPFQIDYGTHKAGLRWEPVTVAGCYVPGGRFPLASSALMTISAARAAGVRKVIVCSPDSSTTTLAACEIAGADAFFNVGGAQAIAAMAFGTKTIPRADVIAGPGNSWVTEAKRQLQGYVGIDMIAGPSEVALVVDGTSCARQAAADLLAQTEHDIEATAWCISADACKLTEISAALEKTGNTGEIRMVIAESVKDVADLCNMLAPEHLQLSTANPCGIKSLFTSYGALFLGEGTPVPLGDYAAGPNHTLPTGGSARFSGGLTPFAFLRPQGWVRNYGGELPLLAGDFASLEGLRGHEEACRLRCST